MTIIPITFKTACEFINKYHRHHSATIGCKFCIGLQKDNQLIGVAVCGRPVSRYLDDNKTCEINRLCTLGEYNACSMLYGACCRIAKQMGYTKIITYILESENGASLKASNFILESNHCGGKNWTGSRNRDIKTPNEYKKLYSKML